MVEAAVGLGVIVSLIFTELLGASAGGIVVPGYIALYLDRPVQIITTLLVALATWFVIRGISQFTILYGKRRMALSILVGFILGWMVTGMKLSLGHFSVESIGFIIPGLIANWIERQGIIKTMSTMIIAAILVRIALMVISGGEVNFHV
ncbi:MAG: poly-gamma-glutamate biosynthesis protein PgsC [Candidatus Cloacimonetes bacterium 4572_65]|nr:MAG: poly-gamma-glutamate biosynthesis protein PgsC [Candidatus Cloacimonetes bacterium 4572_65]